MLITVQFPLADVRPFLEDDARVPVAAHFSRDDLRDTAEFGGKGRPPFLPGVGPLRKRRQATRYAGEELYFRARRSLSFADQLAHVPDSLAGAPVPVRVFFRRMQAFREQHELARYEVGLALDLAGRAAYSEQAGEQLVRACLTLPVHTRRAVSTVALLQAGPHVAAEILRSTTRRKLPAPHPWALSARMPMVLVEYGKAELSGPPSGARRVSIDSDEKIELACARSTIAQLPCVLWYVRTNEDVVEIDWSARAVANEQTELARELRINLMRQHAEREVLAHVLDCIAIPERLSVRGPELNHTLLRDYLLRATARLTRAQRFGLSQAPLLQALSDLDTAAAAIDHSNEGRYRERWTHLSEILDVELFSKLYSALEHMPMGSPEETLELRRLTQATRTQPPRVAISYAHADDRLKQSFVSHVQSAVNQGMIKQWDDRWIPAGSTWQAEIDDRFMEADVVVLLVSEAFLASQFCMQKEVPLVLERVARGEALVVPVIVRPCKWQTHDFAKYQAVLPHGKSVVECGNRADAWRRVMHRVLSARRTPAQSAN